MILVLHPLHDDECLLDEWYFVSLPGSINGLDFQEIQSWSHPEQVRSSSISFSNALSMCSMRSQLMRPKLSPSMPCLICLSISLNHSQSCSADSYEENSMLRKYRHFRTAPRCADWSCSNHPNKERGCSVYNIGNQRPGKQDHLETRAWIPRARTMVGWLCSRGLIIVEEHGKQGVKSCRPISRSNVVKITFVGLGSGVRIIRDRFPSHAGTLVEVVIMYQYRKQQRYAVDKATGGACL
jgi:hypothetical protein